MTEPSKDLLVRDLRVSLEERDADPVKLAAPQLGCEPSSILSAKLVRRSLDARRGRPRFVLSIRVQMENPPDPLPPGVVPAPGPDVLPPPPRVRGNHAVAIVGTGPAGLFAAERLCQAGLSPVLIDRGEDLEARHQDIAALLREGRFNPESNFHFGLGGAGTYSDGKLFTRLDLPVVRQVLRRFQELGAGSEDQILVEAQPHVGTDRWPATLLRFRRELSERGCTFLFKTRVTGLVVREGRLSALALADGQLDCQAALLAPGNSSRDLFESLQRSGLALLPKPFAVGVRMVHPQALIDGIQYSRFAGHPALPPASYRLTGTFGGRGVYSFCMCPGGQVIPTPTEENHLCLNGMSNSERSSGEANAALVVTVSPDDTGDPKDPLGGVRFQRALERAAFAAGGGLYHAPAQRLRDFLNGRRSRDLPGCLFVPGVNPADVGALLPPALLDPLKAGLLSFSRKMRGFDDPAALVLGLETRTSSPVRILRGADGMSPSAEGLFPAGEGAGYAGGITSSAVDGLRAADALLAWLGKP